ncbi:LysE family translocator [Parvibaculum sp.]|uniref:LysE family translocator n=1 Tax=Parvibaculum sp. TaxID=2024848 RepID=UPI002CC6F811|nr:LysE family translocator [Parvibaculum sp.]HUD50344.1 LysE family translocator [Parvibaculum sp.]
MTLNLYLAFVAATLLVCIVPGPVVTYLVTTGIRQGPRDALIGLAGSTSALCIHMMLVTAGLASLLAALGTWAEVLKLVGAAYLVWLGFSAWRAPVETDDGIGVSSPRLRPSVLYRRGLLISLTNPKTLAFYAAFFPQFISPERPAMPQLILLAVSFILLSALSDGTYAVAAGRLAPYLKSPRAQKIRNRTTGAVLAAAGLSLALARR